MFSCGVPVERFIKVRQCETAMTRQCIIYDTGAYNGLNVSVKLL